MASNNPTVVLKDVLYEFTLAKAVPDAELLDDFIRRYPEHAAALTKYAVDLALDPVPEDEAASVPATLETSPTVSRVMSRFQNQLFKIKQAEAAQVQKTSSLDTEEENPFAALDREGVHQIIKNIEANTVFYIKLRDRGVEPNSISDGFKKRLAEELHTSFKSVEAHFAARQQVQGGQFYKADQKPEMGSQQSFEEAIRTSGLTDEQQRHLLSL